MCRRASLLVVALLPALLRLPSIRDRKEPFVIISSSTLLVAKARHAKELKRYF